MAVAHRMCRPTTLCVPRIETQCFPATAHSSSSPTNHDHRRSKPRPRFAFYIHYYHAAVLCTGQVTASRETVNTGTGRRIQDGGRLCKVGLCNYGNPILIVIFASTDHQTNIIEFKLCFYIIDFIHQMFYRNCRTAGYIFVHYF